MIRSRNILTLSCAVLISLAAAHAQATVVIDRVLVDDAGNAADTNGRGAVGSDFYMGTYHVTNDQYVEFLNGVDPTGANTLGVYQTTQTSDAAGGIDYTPGNPNGTKYSSKTNFGNKPVNFVSWVDGMRFVNWLESGQGTTTETGTYTLLGGTAIPSNATTVTRNGSVTYFLPSVDEWYKAAYYKGGSLSAGYWDYPTQSDSVPTVATANSTGDVTNPTQGTVTYGGTDWAGGPDRPTSVGTAGSVTFYGVYDMGGNERNWTDTISGGSRFKVGTHFSGDDYNMNSSTGVLDTYGTGSEDARFGLRVAAYTAAEAEAVPEPSTFVLAGLGLFGLGFVALQRKFRRA